MKTQHKRDADTQRDAVDLVEWTDTSGGFEEHRTEYFYNRKGR